MRKGMHWGGSRERGGEKGNKKGAKSRVWFQFVVKEKFKLNQIKFKFYISRSIPNQNLSKSNQLNRNYP